ncbi:hypothetical protein PJL18_03982 [Paenarthrobacter nicotinovorans]|nr:hypothetical protein [Paenarthrobacter nicotinovorans]
MPAIQIPTRLAIPTTDREMLVADSGSPDASRKGAT